MAQPNSPNLLHIDEVEIPPSHGLVAARLLVEFGCQGIIDSLILYTIFITFRGNPPQS